MGKEKITYEGPACLREYVLDLYRSLSWEHERGDLRIAVGVPELAASPWRGFTTQKALQEYVEKRYRDISKLIARGKHEPVIGALREFNQAVPPDGKYAAYAYIQDKVYLHPFTTTISQLTGEKMANQDLNVHRHLDHELAHHDLGICVPREEQRANVQEYASLLALSARLKKAATSTPAAERWLEGEEGLELRRRLGFPQSLQELISRRNAQYHALLDTADAIERDCHLLLIDVADEAFACNHTGGPSLFWENWGKNHAGRDRNAAQKIYGAVEALVRREGKLRAMRAVREAMDAAYTEKRPIACMLP